MSVTAAIEYRAPRVSDVVDPQPVLADCVAPLVRDLRERGLIGGYFFENHWADGGHVVLRLRPTAAAETEEVCRVAEAAVRRFLARLPVDPATGGPGGADPGEGEHVVLLYAEDERPWLFPNGAPPARQTGALRHRPYRPDHDRYGGPAGVALAEWHFEHSSDLVLELVHSTDAHLRATRLGLSAQLTMVMAATFLPDPARLAAHVDHPRPAAPGPATRALARRLAETRAVLDSGDLDRLGGFRAEWAWHCHELRESVLRLGNNGELIFPDPLDDPHAVLGRLLTPYLAATDNRLGMTRADQDYLARLLATVLRDVTGAAAD